MHIRPCQVVRTVPTVLTVLTVPTVLTVLTVLTVVTVPAVLTAQVRASEPASVSQTVDGTTISLEYSRPRVRERDTLFGKVVHWQEVWTPGANWATTIEVSKNVKLNGRELAKGKYSVWLVVRPKDDWTLVLDTRHRRFHMQPVDSTADQFRLPVKPQVSPFTEVLTWSFSGIRADGATLAMQWGTTAVNLDITVTPSYELTVAPARAAPFLGNYSFSWSGGPDAKKVITLFVTHDNGSLIGRWEPAPFPEWDRFILIPISEEWFVPGFLEKGKLYDVEKSMVFEFKTDGGKVEEFKVRSEGDQVIATGKRKS
jgi:hypothetical protein